jgi:hypothetical protein
MGLLAAQELARRFDTSSPVAIDTLAALFAMDSSSGATIEQLIALGTEALAAAGVPTMDQARQAVRLGAGPNIPEMKPFPDWRAATEEDMRADLGEVSNLIRDAQNLTDPAQLAQRINQIRNGVVQLRQMHMRFIADARANASIWVPVGSPGWNETEISGGPTSLTGILDAEMASVMQQLQTLEALQRQLEEQAAAAAAAPVAPAAPAPAATVAPAAPAQTGFQRVVGDVFSGADATQALERGASALATGRTELPGSALGARVMDFFTTPVDDPEAFAAGRDEARMLMQLLRTPAAQRFLMDNPQTRELLDQDPVAWARQLRTFLEQSRQ